MSEKPKSDLNLDRFEKWHDIIKDNIQDFFSTHPEALITKLDYSMESLSVLGNWLVEQYSDFDKPANSDDGQSKIHQGIIYYVGEVYRKYLEGHWNVHFKELEPDYEYGEELVIEGFHHDVALCPYAEIVMAIAEKNGERLQIILEDFIKIYRSKRKF